MGWWGSIAGGTLGFMVGGPLGAVVGAAIGHSTQRRARKQIDFDSQADFGGEDALNERRQLAVFSATFSVLGYVSKADGRVSVEEVEYAKAAMDRMELNSEQKKFAIESFRHGKSSNFNFDGVMRQLNFELGRDKNLKRVFLGFQIEVAFADGILGAEEKSIIHKIGDYLGITRFEVEHLIVQYEDLTNQGQYNGDQYRQDNYQKSSRSNIASDEDYNLLGLKRNASLAEVKRAYHSKIRQYHPDKLISKGLPEEMMKFANEKSEKLNGAYQRIRKEKSARN